MEALEARRREVGPGREGLMALASPGCEMSSSSYTAGPRPQLPGLWAAELASVASTQALQRDGWRDCEAGGSGRRGWARARNRLWRVSLFGRVRVCIPGLVNGNASATRAPCGQSPEPPFVLRGQKERNETVPTRDGGGGQGPHLHEQDFGRTIRGTGGLSCS